MRVMKRKTKKRESYICRVVKVDGVFKIERVIGRWARRKDCEELVEASPRDQERMLAARF